MGHSYPFRCLKACTLARESKYEIIGVIQPLIRAKGPQKPYTITRMMAQKGQCIVVLNKRVTKLALFDLGLF